MAEVLPASLFHLSAPVALTSDEHFVVAEVSSEPVGPYSGTRLFATALVPLDLVDEVIRNPGGIGWEVESWGPLPFVDPGVSYDSAFWINGRQGGERFETLTPSWSRHNRRVFTIDSGFLMCYGLVPRLVESTAEIIWDDPSRPRHDVVRMTPLSRYDMRGGYTTARVSVDRDYLEDYLSVKRCAAVGVYYEERYSKDDAVFAGLVRNSGYLELTLPGRKVKLKLLPDWGAGPQYSEVWGCTLVLKPTSRPISEEEIEPLRWPDYPKLLTERDARGVGGPFEYVYVRDAVLESYESRPDFTVIPMSGSVYHGSWWSVSDCRRVLRNHISVELHKLYEGSGNDTIRHYNAHAVSRAEAEKDRVSFGGRHIGERANEVIANFVRVVDALQGLLARCNISESASAVSTATVKYEGWWRMGEFRALGHVVPLKLDRDRFLARCKELYKLLESLREAPLRRALLCLGLSADPLKDYRSFKLLGVLLSLQAMANDRGLDLVRDSAAIAGQWKTQSDVGILRSLLALNELRQLDSHPQGSDFEKRLKSALAIFGVSLNETANGWGLALDKIYDEIAERLGEIAGHLGGS
jgi:hypothetical protein